MQGAEHYWEKVVEMKDFEENAIETIMNNWIYLY